MGLWPWSGGNGIGPTWIGRTGTGYSIPGLYIISGNSTYILMKHIAKTSIL
jgi:hypothetical protein